MDKDRIKGKMKDIAGRVERKAGELTGNKELEAEGADKQVEGKIQNTVGKVKDAAKDALGKRKREIEEHREKIDDKNAA